MSSKAGRSRSKVSTSTEKQGWLQRHDDGRRWFRVYVVLRNFTLYVFEDQNIKELQPIMCADMKGATVQPLDSRTTKRHALEIVNATRLPASRSAGSSAAAAADANGGAAEQVEFRFAGESREESERWLMYLCAASVRPSWPGGLGVDKRPAPFLFSAVERQMREASRGAAGEEGKAAAQAACERSGAVPQLPNLTAVPGWQQRALVLRKLRLCATVFDQAEAAAGPAVGAGEQEAGDEADPARAVTTEARDIKRRTLLELVDFFDLHGKVVFHDYRVLEDTVSMIRANLFRSLPKAAVAVADPDEDEEPFMDHQWPHLAVVYEFLLHLVSLDHIELPVIKRLIDQAFVKNLLLLFDSEDMRERDYLKTITHRVYSKLTQRRALIRRVICNVFFEFVYETLSHNGIAEMLEILASIINGFATPIKEEHKVMLERALIPLHKAPSVAAFHPQLSYCMALYVAKDHTLTRKIIPGLLKFWPFGSSQKEMMFMNELDDIFEYVQQDDLKVFRDQLARRLSRAVGGLHFQVAERALCLWNSERFNHLLVETEETRAQVMRVLVPTLHDNANNHWHENVRTMSSHVLEQYVEAAPDLYRKCVEDMEKAKANGGPAGGGGQA